MNGERNHHSNHSFEWNILREEKERQPKVHHIRIGNTGIANSKRVYNVTNNKTQNWCSMRIDMKRSTQKRAPAFVSCKTTFSHGIRWLNDAFPSMPFPFSIFEPKLNNRAIVKHLNANGGTTETFMKICDMNSHNAIEQNGKCQKFVEHWIYRIFLGFEYRILDTEYIR